MTALLIADHDNRRLRPATAQALTAVAQMSDSVDVLVAGNGCEAVADEVAKLAGVRTVLLAENPRLAQELPEVLADLVVSEAKGYSHIFFAATTLGKAAMPRVAALLDRAPFSDVIAVKGPKTFQRGIYAGALVATVETDEDVVVGTVRTTAFEAAPQGSAVAPVERITCPEAGEGSRFVKFTEIQSDRPELVSARVVVAGGRGLIDEAGFKALEDLADSIGAAVGATRTAVDMGLCPNDWQVGQTGKMIAPQLYIAFGISGAIQHTAGIKDAKVIVAVDKDPEAPIFEVADYGLIADGAETCRALQQKLAK
ncbi:electron transfer flavoprotein subunit alpha/FixB family protein [Sutterella sp.]|uniref:electron transfer flavoprotein subunit alpha/FixB family protein n=1 Tax=Sutterella sp. TaxID=1981025 RepID=UPI0026E05051|nr:electron transfer flavoprotein subunit alpha/FixB family protein [Sutterella sp.]MDO5531943.1 electron transfer flavoprotein subunit alpha/FixB family protein [Sutterella sp.]